MTLINTNSRLNTTHGLDLLSQQSLIIETVIHVHVPHNNFFPFKNDRNNWDPAVLKELAQETQDELLNHLLQKKKIKIKFILLLIKQVPQKLTAL